MRNHCETETLDIRHTKYHVRLMGNSDAPIVFLLHGLLDTGASFAPMIEAMQHNWRLLVPDWRGHGESAFDPQGYWFPDYVADLDQLVEHYAQDQPVRLVAHSMGATAAGLFAGLRPEKVSHLVCLDALNVPARTAEMVPDRYRRWLDAQSSPPAAKTYKDIAALESRVRHNYPELKDEHIQQLAADWSVPAPDGGIRLATDPLHFVASPYGFIPEHAIRVWALATAKVFCLDGASSPARKWINEEEMQRRRAAFQHLRHEVLLGCGHMLHLEQPEAVAERVENFLLK